SRHSGCPTGSRPGPRRALAIIPGVARALPPTPPRGRLNATHLRTAPGYGLGGAQGAGNQIAVIDMAGKKVARMIDLGTYTRPHAVVPVAGSPLKLIVTSETTQNILTVDAEKGVVLSAIPTGAAGSHMVAVSADAKRAFTANIRP